MPDIDKVASRPREYLSESGLPLLMGGLIFIVLGGSVFIQQALPKASVEQLVVQWIGVCVAGAIMWGAKALTRRIVFPRGGYVVPRMQRGHRAFYVGSLVVAVALSLFAIFAPGRLHLLESRSIPPGLALWGAIILLAGGWRERRAGMMWCGVYFLGLVPLLWWMPVNEYARMSALQLASGVLMAGTGAVALRRFLKANPALAEQKDE